MMSHMKERGSASEPSYDNDTRGELNIVRKLYTLLFMVLLCCLFVVPAAASTSHMTISIEIDGKTFEAKAYVINNRTMVPLRAIFEKLEAEVTWHQETQSITAVKGDTKIMLRLNSTEAQINDQTTVLDVPPVVIEQSTFVPLRFVSEALGAEVSYDAQRKVAIVNTTPADCESGQVHSGTIDPTGETWKACGSPHFVRGDFYIEGLESPVLTIEEGAIVRFESGASPIVGESAPGGLIIEGTTDKPVVLTADSSSPRAGFWQGVRFYELTLRDKAIINGASIEYAGAEDQGALYVHSSADQLEVTVSDTALSNSFYAGIQLTDNTRFSEDSGNITISGTVSSRYGGGFPIITDLTGSDELPDGRYADNEFGAIRITGINTYDILSRSTTWRNLGVPYDIDIMVTVEGAQTPKLTIEPGVTTIWAPDTSLAIAETNKGALHAVGTPQQPIVFTSSMERSGGWTGIMLGSLAISENIQLQHAVLEDAIYGVYLYDDLGPVIRDTVFRNHEIYAIYMPNYEEGQTDYTTGLGNTFEHNGADQNIQE